MFTGHWELLIIGLIVLLLFVGPKKLPGFGKSLGESIRGFKKAMNETDDALDVTDSTKREQIEGSKAEEASKEKATEKTDA